MFPEMRETVSVTIDGRAAEARPGETILQAMRRLGLDVPVLCYHPRLPPSGSCRACLVEVDGSRTLVPSCARRAEPGMVVRTATPRAEAARKMVIELLLADHPIPCGACLRPEGCELENWAARLGLRGGRFTSHGNGAAKDPSNPAIVFDPAACILCHRCIRACDDIQVNEVIGLEGRGARSRIIFDMGDPMGQSSCVTCGECVQVCPTGALLEKTVAALPGPAPERSVKSVCPYCGVGCTIDYRITAEGAVTRALGAEEGPANRGRLCVKGRFGWTYAQHPDRLTVPLIRREGVPRGLLDGRPLREVFREAAWEEALGLVARRLREIGEAHGAESLCGFSSAKCTNEENYLFQKFIRAVLGSPHIDHCTRLCHSSSVHALQASLGSGSMSNSIDDIPEADVLIVTGSNTTENHPVIATFLKQAARRGSRLIVVDTREIPLCRQAHLFLRLNPGTDVALYNGLMHLILKHGWHKPDFIREHTEGFEDLRRVVEPYTPTRVEAITGVPRRQLEEAARLIGTAGRTAVCWGMGVSQHTTGSDNSFSLINLMLLTGNLGRPGVGLNPLRGQNNVQGASDMGAIPMAYPGYEPADDPRVVEKWRAAWGRTPPPKKGLTVTEIMEAAGRGLRSIYIMGENPLLSDPNLEHARQCFGRFDFIAVQDIFLTETAQYADVVLPAASALEKEGTYANTDRRVQRGRPVLPLPGQARQDWEILQDLCRRLGYSMDYRSPEDIQQEIARWVPDYAGITYPRIEHRGLQWPVPAPGHPGTPILYTERIGRGRGIFRPAEYAPARELPDGDYPLVLNTGRYLAHWHTGSMTRRSRVLDEISPEPHADMNPRDLRRLGLRGGEMARVASRRGEVVLRVRPRPGVAPGNVFIPFHFREAAANLLTIDAVDPHAKIPEFKFCAVRVERIR
ncbi:MAG: formate dehydrogenase subunit alpha [Euryarchaeota archaeon]|nr:formate dehydrogenase subunit alpha [Euryarchaeota archaeon]